MEDIDSKKVVVVGDAACGKTCLLVVFNSQPFPAECKPTIYETSVVTTVVDGKQVELVLHDTAGQETYDRLRPIAYPETDVFLVCFSVARYVSLINIEERWLPEIQHHCPNTPYVLVGNMTDLRSAPGIHREPDYSSGELVTTKQGQQMAEKIKAFAYVECSALKREGVTEVFEVAVRATLQSVKKKPLCKLL